MSIITLNSSTSAFVGGSSHNKCIGKSHLLVVVWLCVVGAGTTCMVFFQRVSHLSYFRVGGTHAQALWERETDAER